MINKTDILREGKAKIVYHTDNPDYVWIHFKDDATAFDGAKKAVVRDKGQINSAISIHLLKLMEENGIPTHLVSSPTERDQICHKLDIVPIEVVVRNVAAGSICRRFGLEQGLELEQPLVEFFYKDDDLGDPLINDCHITAFGWAKESDIEIMKDLTLKTNSILVSLFDEADLILVDFKIEFGLSDGKIYLGDEFTPDGCRVWDKETKKKLDKDRFRLGLGDVVESYQEIAHRLGIELT